MFSFISNALHIRLVYKLLVSPGSNAVALKPNAHQNSAYQPEAAPTSKTENLLRGKGFKNRYVSIAWAISMPGSVGSPCMRNGGCVSVCCTSPQGPLDILDIRRVRVRTIHAPFFAVQSRSPVRNWRRADGRRTVRGQLVGITVAPWILSLPSAGTMSRTASAARFSRSQLRRQRIAFCSEARCIRGCSFELLG